MSAALIGGAIAAILATLVSLPLRSPDDIIFNSATVTIGALAAGLTAGLVWRWLRAAEKRVVVFSGVWAVLFLVTAGMLFVGQTQLDRVVSYALPLAAIVFVVTAVFTIALAGNPMARRWLAAAAVAVSLGIGIGLAGQGDEESGRLELPPPSSGSSLIRAYNNLPT